MSTGNSYVEAPKADANAAVLSDLERQCMAQVQEVQQVAVAAETEEKQSLNVAEEGRKQASRENQGGSPAGASAEGEVAVGMAEGAALPASVQLASTGLQSLSERASNPTRGVNLGKIGKEMGGMVASKNTSSFEDMFSSMKKSGPLGSISGQGAAGSGLFERSSIAGQSLGGQKEANLASWNVNTQHASCMRNTRDFVMANKLANEAVLAQVRGVRMAAGYGPGAGGPQGMGPSLMNGPKGPTSRMLSEEEGAWG